MMQLVTLIVAIILLLVAAYLSRADAAHAVGYTGLAVAVAGLGWAVLAHVH